MAMPRAAFSSRLIALMLIPVCLGFCQSATKAATKKKSTASPTATKRVVSKKAGAATSSGKQHARTSVASSNAVSGGSARAGSRKVVVTRKLVHGKWVRTTQIVHSDPGPSYQTHPDQERYQQIQQALAAKGYFKGEANGQWGDDSVAALKQFQTERKIPNDGKISALSLIGLGLGPNRETAGAKSEVAAPTAQSETVVHSTDSHQ
jgi:hypothetical protein